MPQKKHKILGRSQCRFGTSHGGVLEGMTFEQFVISDIRKTYRGSEVVNFNTEKLTQDARIIHRRKTLFNDFIDISELKNSFMSQLAAAKTKEFQVTTNDLLSFSSVLDEAVDSCIVNFGRPDRLIEISEDVFVVMTDDADAVTLSLCNPSRGCIVVTQPCRMAIIRIKEQNDAE